MSWWRQTRPDVPTTPPTPPSSPPSQSTVTAAATVRGARERIVAQTESWQDEVWGYYDALGEFRFAVEWHSNALSRVRLRAARVQPDQDEPEIVDDGRAAELVAELASDVAGRAQLMKQFTQLLDIPGEAWLVGETVDGRNLWEVRSTSELRPRGGTVEVIDVDQSQGGEMRWRPLAGDYLVGRVWRPHARFRHVADSPTRPARATMRELELVNRKIQAQYLSRLASAGIVIFPEEITFPVREEFQDEIDPFVAEWVETARTAIREPGTASAIIPIPLRVPGEYVDKVRFIDFTQQLDDRIIEKRESAIRRLATQLDLPAEVMLGMGEVNHWSAWQLDESAIKIHISPMCEMICHGLTAVYLHPRLAAEGEDTAEWVIWYDTSELALRPDRSAGARDAYDRLEISAKAYRRETGFDEDDAPEPSELVDQALRLLVRQPATALQALNELVPGTVDAPTTPPAPDVDGDSEEDPGPPAPGQTEPPDTRDEPPPAPDDGAASARGIRTTVMPDDVIGHRLSIRAPDGTWFVEHPASCQRASMCPVTWSAFLRGYGPGTPGVYELNAIDGDLAIGRRLLDGVTDHDPRRNGHATSRVR